MGHAKTKLLYEMGELHEAQEDAFLVKVGPSDYQLDLSVKRRAYTTGPLDDDDMLELLKKISNETKLKAGVVKFNPDKIDNDLISDWFFKK